jgi:squalene-hopene/tetraprenyl-beta-curcumene cyclase
MANAVMMFRTLGYPDDHPAMVTARRAIELLKVERGDQIWFQPCVSPVWDTGLSAHALLEGGHREDPRLVAMLDWLKDKQILDHKGDWQVRRPDVRPGGWAFQHANPDYPDVDDTAVVAMAMHRQGDPKYADAIERACEWIVGMQSSNGGWGAFEPENEHFYLNAIPFADHGALLDPPTVDVTARCIGLLAQVDAARFAEPIARAIAWVRREQEADGSWFGRWGANYVYGTWSVLVALKAAGVDMGAPWVRKAVGWLKAQQREDGGWGEGLETYEPGVRGHAIASTASQTAWALLGLMSAGELDSEEVARGVKWLEEAPREEGPRWEEALYTGTGFPKVFYLKYHGYAAFFPLWAVARYQALRDSNSRDVAWGM